MKYNIKFNDLIEFKESDDILTISGRAWKGLRVSNKKVLLSSEAEISNIAKTLNGVPLQADHSKSIKDTVGRVIESKKDGESVLYRAEVHDKEIGEKIKRGLISQCSVSLAADKIDEEYKFEGEKWTALTGVSVIELSLVLRGAIEGNSVYPEFEFSIIEDGINTDIDGINTESYDHVVDELYKSVNESLLKKYNYLLEMFEETDRQLNDKTKELDNLNKKYEFLLAYERELPEKYLSFDLETIMLYGELMSEAENYTTIIGGISGGEESNDETDPKLEAKEALKDMIFDRDNPKKDIKTFSDWQKKYGDLSDFK